MASPATAKRLLGLFFLFLCPGCGRRVPMKGSRLCAWCLARVHPVTGPEPRPAAFLHRGVMREMMIRLKYSGERHLGGVLAEMALEEWSLIPSPGDTVTCVPSSPATLRRRGYNQVGIMARRLAALTGCRFTGILARRPGPSQVGLSALERRLNLEGAFHTVQAVPGGRVWLLDDVLATGETLRQASRALRRGGAEDVVPLAVNFRETRRGSMIERNGEPEPEGREDSRDS
jgi:ComF family protein